MTHDQKAYGPIGLFDSGIGGMTVANAIQERLPREALFYLADTANVPYGPRSRETIQRYSFTITDYLLEQGSKIIVVACNTATAAAINELREGYPDVFFVGMEPAVKPAGQSTRSGKVGVLATQTTLGSERYHTLTDRFASDVEVWEDPCLGLVPLIEAGKFDAPETEALLHRILDPMLKEGVDTIVLGCTHYPLITPLIRRIGGEDLLLIDPAPAAARQTERLLTEHHLLAPPDAALPPRHHFLATGPSEGLDGLVQRFFPGYRAERVGIFS